MLTLARREGVRLIRHPVFIAGALISLVQFGFLTWNRAPVLHRDAIHSIGGLLPLAAATLIVANLAIIRASRDGTEELYEGLPTPALMRTGAHLMSLAWAVAGALVVLGVMFAYLFLDDPVGTPRFAEVAAGPTTVVLFGAIGILLGRWKKHIAIAPLAVVALGAIQIMLMQPVIGTEPISTRTPWLAPWVPTSLTSGVPPELVIRPAGWHLVYLVGLVTMVVAGALLRHGARARLAAVLITGLVITGVGEAGQLRGPSAQERAKLIALLEHPEDHQICRPRNGITYCAYPAYAPWIDRWARAVEGALEPVPEELRPTGLTVRQTFGTYFEGSIDVPNSVINKLRPWSGGQRRNPSDDIFVDFQWGRGSMEGHYELGLTLSVLMRPLEFATSRSELTLTAADIKLLKRTLLPRIPKRRRERFVEKELQVGKRWSSCHTYGQARGAIALWLALQGTPASESAARKTAEDNAYGIHIDHEQKAFYYLGPFAPIYPVSVGNPDWQIVNWTDDEFRYAIQMLDQRPDVERALNEDWDQLTDPETKTTVLIERFGLEELPTPQELKDQVSSDYVTYEKWNNVNHAQYLAGIPPCH